MSPLVYWQAPCVQGTRARSAQEISEKRCISSTARWVLSGRQRRTPGFHSLHAIGRAFFAEPHLPLRTHQERRERARERGAGAGYTTQKHLLLGCCLPTRLITPLQSLPSRSRCARVCSCVRPYNLWSVLIACRSSPLSTPSIFHFPLPRALSHSPLACESCASSCCSGAISPLQSLEPAPEHYTLT